MAAATAAFEEAQAQVLILREEWQAAIKVHEVNVMKLT